MTEHQKNAESGKALFDLISDLSAGYRTNAVLTAGLHLASSSALTHWSKRSSKRKCRASGLSRQSVRSGPSNIKTMEEADLAPDEPLGRLRLIRPPGAWRPVSDTVCFSQRPRGKRGERE